MEISRLENLPPPPGIINSIRAGFDSIATHITAIFFPLMLNLFLWLGPRLRVDVLFDSIKSDLIRTWQSLRIPAEEIERMITSYEVNLPSINLFWFLRTLPIGISSLQLPQEATSSTPIGNTDVWQVSGWSLPLWILLLMFIGWIGGAIYFRAVAWIATPNEKENIHMLNAILQTILISIFCTILFVIFAPFIALILQFSFRQNVFIASIVILVLSLTSMWVIVPIFFLPHGVFVFQENEFKAVLSSVKLARFTLPNSSLFVLTVFLLAYGLNFLWSMPSEESWL